MTSRAQRTYPLRVGSSDSHSPFGASLCSGERLGDSLWPRVPLSHSARLVGKSRVKSALWSPAAHARSFQALCLERGTARAPLLPAP
ncbi:hypothetical protein PGTUg99_013100 [Puccinia graminis f. sp. tritici]|uniref:Uncharacterized protein n=1 Tax=Puccinia graminis f. sp. tritici TaxID=56615 RepID=A0A5B0RY24_PUCGR|nr:hypothetical protein PGTUg99_013100 [Puccinia graminis f. sp. tritici]